MKPLTSLGNANTTCFKCGMSAWVCHWYEINDKFWSLCVDCANEADL